MDLQKQVADFFKVPGELKTDEGTRPAMNKEERERRLETILKPCPFCGRKVSACEIEATSAGVHRIEVRCICGATIEIKKEILYTWKDSFLPESAVQTWNTRNGEKGEEGLNE